MNDKHIPFEKISDLLDNDIYIAEERDQIIAHINECPLCKKEYEYLKATISYCIELSSVPVCLDDICTGTLKKVKFRKQKKLAFKVVPAVAASILLIIGFAMDNGFISGDDPTIISQGSETQSDEQNVMQIIQNNDASITKVTDIYVEGKISINRFNQLRRQLGSRVVTYSVVDGAPPRNTNPYWRAGMENVGTTGHGINYPPDYIGDTTNERYILFRIHR
jgi:hypothetical protein